MDKKFRIPKPAAFDEIQAIDEEAYKKLRAKGWKSKNPLARRKLRLQKKRAPWQIFENKIYLFFKEALGFPYVEHGRYFGRSQVDIAAGIDDILLIIDCKTKDEPGIKNLHTYITAHSGKQGTILRNVRERFGNKYKKIFFVLALQDIDYSDDDVTYAKDSKVFLWGEKYIEILEELYRIFGTESRYYFLKELGIKRIPIRDDGVGRFYETPALLLKHDGLKIFNFFIEAKKLLKLSYVARIESGNKDFYQRLVAKSRLNEIAGFIEDKGTFKNSIIVSFENRPPKSKPIRLSKPRNGQGVDVVQLKIRKDYLSLWVIDGQHRLYGFTRVADQYQNNFLPVVAIQDINASEQAKTFIDINQKQKPVDSSLLWELFSQLRSGKEEGAISALVKKLASKGVFRGKIYIPGSARRRRKSYGIYFSNFCKGIHDRGILDSGDNNSLFYLMGKEKYASESGITRVSREINAYFSLLESIAKAAKRPRWIKDFIFTNNGLNVFLRVFSHYLDHSGGKISRREMNKVLRGPLKQYFIAKSDAIDVIRRQTSSEGIREEVAYEIVKRINSSNSTFARDYVLRKNKSARETDVYKAYVALEKALRKFTQKRLSKLTTNWWNERLPGDVRMRAEEAFKKGETPFIYIKPRKQIDCLDFMDYLKIFTTSNNWKDTFQSVFKDEDVLKGKFKEMKPIRNKIAHPADMDAEEHDKFLDFCEKMTALTTKRA